MNISRKTSYLISVLIVLSFFGMGVLFLGLQTSDDNNDTYSLSVPDGGPNGESGSQGGTVPLEQDPLKQDSPSTPPIPSNSESDSPSELPKSEGKVETQQNTEAGFALKDFHRSETKDGKLLWEVVGKNARYYPEDKRVDVEDCIFSSLDDEGKQIVLRAGKAKLYVTGPELQSAHFSADVTLDYDSEFKILTPEAVYEHKEGFVSTSAHVTVVGSWYMIEGDGLRAYLDKEQYEILNNVSSVMEPGKRKREGSA